MLFEFRQQVTASGYRIEEIEPSKYSNHDERVAATREMLTHPDGLLVEDKPHEAMDTEYRLVDFQRIMPRVLPMFLNIDSPQAVKAFADQYGPLGLPPFGAYEPDSAWHFQNITYHYVHLGNCRESITDWYNQVRYMRDILRQTNTSSARAIIKHWTKTRWESEGFLRLIKGSLRESGLSEYTYPVEALEAYVNQHCRYISPVFRNGQFVLFAQSLLAAMWGHMACILTGTVEYKRCENLRCPYGGWFIPDEENAAGEIRRRQAITCCKECHDMKNNDKHNPRRPTTVEGRKAKAPQ